MLLLSYEQQLELLYFKLKTETPYILILKEREMKNALLNTISYFLEKEFNIKETNVVRDLFRYVCSR